MNAWYLLPLLVVAAFLGGVFVGGIAHRVSDPTEPVVRQQGAYFDIQILDDKGLPSWERNSLIVTDVPSDGKEGIKCEVPGSRVARDGGKLYFQPGPPYRKGHTTIWVKGDSSSKLHGPMLVDDQFYWKAVSANIGGEWLRHTFVVPPWTTDR